MYGHCNKAYQGVIRNLQRVRISCFENCYKTAKQIPTSLKVEIKFKDITFDGK